MGIDTAARIRFWRERAGKTATECAAAMGLHKSGLSRIEAGRQRVTGDQLEALAAHLGLTMAEFYGELPDAPASTAAQG